MLLVKRLIQDRDQIIDRFKKRNFDASATIDSIIELDKSRKELKTALDNGLAKVNSLSKDIGQLFKEGKRDEADELKNSIPALKDANKALEERLNETSDQLEELLINLPNVPHESVPAGNTDEDNEVIQDWTEPMPDLPENALPHWDLAEKYNLIDFKLGVRITGSGFPLFRGQGSKIQRALINFFLDEAHQAGYEEIIPPLMVNEDTARATGQLPDKEGQMYHVEKENLFLIPTAEVPITNIYRGEILSESDFPIKLTGHTPCWRREAGSYGSDVKGLNRVHQFDKIEIVQIEHPDRSYATLNTMLDHVSQLLNKLELPYRILRLCGGDLGFTSALTFDFEVYSAGQKKWLEVSSVSNFESFQSNRMKLRYKDGDGKMQLAHTLNGSALALARIMAAVLENNQTEDGIIVPKVLRKYTGFDKVEQK
jgi:seryl-tRNA synthetase